MLRNQYIRLKLAAKKPKLKCFFAVALLAAAVNLQTSTTVARPSPDTTSARAVLTATIQRSAGPAASPPDSVALGSENFAATDPGLEAMDSSSTPPLIGMQEFVGQKVEEKINMLGMFHAINEQQRLILHELFFESFPHLPEEIALGAVIGDEESESLAGQNALNDDLSHRQDIKDKLVLIQQLYTSRGEHLPGSIVTAADNAIDAFVDRYGERIRAIERVHFSKTNEHFDEGLIEPGTERWEEYVEVGADFFEFQTEMLFRLLDEQLGEGHREDSQRLAQLLMSPGSYLQRLQAGAQMQETMDADIANYVNHLHLSADEQLSLQTLLGQQQAAIVDLAKFGDGPAPTAQQLRKQWMAEQLNKLMQRRSQDTVE